MKPAQKITSVLIVEDHVIASAGLSFILNQQGRFTVLGVINHGDAALAEITRLDPDIAIIDMVLPGKSGLAILESLKSRGARCRVLMISGQATGVEFSHAIDLGADAVISKIDPPEIIFSALEGIIEGRQYISGWVHEFAGSAGDDRVQNLTARERQVLALMTEGLSNTEIAKHIGVEARTAKKHRENLMRKLKVSTAVEASRIAYQLGLVALPRLT
ncbi:MAG: response regulator transcription factor [Alphaproteobacteria bacterium]